MGPKDPHDRKVEGPRLLLRVFEARTLLISNPGRPALSVKQALSEFCSVGITKTYKKCIIDIIGAWGTLPPSHRTRIYNVAEARTHLEFQVTIE